MKTGREYSQMWYRWVRGLKIGLVFFANMVKLNRRILPNFLNFSTTRKKDAENRKVKLLQNILSSNALKKVTFQLWIFKKRKSNGRDKKENKTLFFTSILSIYHHFNG